MMRTPVGALCARIGELLPRSTLQHCQACCRQAGGAGHSLANVAKEYSPALPSVLQAGGRRCALIGCLPLCRGVLPSRAFKADDGHDVSPTTSKGCYPCPEADGNVAWRTTPSPHNHQSPTPQAQQADNHQSPTPQAQQAEEGHGEEDP